MTALVIVNAWSAIDVCWYPPNVYRAAIPIELRLWHFKTQNVPVIWIGLVKLHAASGWPSCKQTLHIRQITINQPKGDMVCNTG